MRHFVVLLSVFVVTVFAVVAFGIRPSANAQEATPSTEAMMPEGLAFEGLAYGVAETLPAAPADLSLFRFGLEPGSSFQLDPNDPSVALVYVESGEASFTIEAPITVLRAPGVGTPFPVENEEIESGTQFILSTGDSAVLPPNAVGELRNNGSEAVSLLVANVAPLAATMAEDETGTPAP